MSEEVVVAGAGFAGINAALRLSRKGFDVKIIDQNSFHLFRPGLVDFIGERVSEDKIKLDLSSFFRDTSMEFSREKILGIDPGKEVVETNSGSYSYDYLVLSLGGEPSTNGLDIAAAEPVYSLSRAKKVKEEVDETEDVLVVGSGHTGIETATELADMGKDVTVVDFETRPMPDSCMNASEAVLAELNRKDVSFRGGCKVTEVGEDSVKLLNDDRIEADKILWAGGVQASEIVQESFDVGPGGLPVNPGLSSREYDNVFAAGDNADYSFTKTAQNAEKQGRLVAENIAKSDEEALEEFHEDKIPMVVSMGDKAVFEYGERVYISRLLRPLKRLIRTRYFLNLKKRRFKLRF